MAVTSPATVDITIYQGATFRRVITAVDIDGAPFDFSDYSGRGQIRAQKRLDSRLVADFTVTAGDPGTDSVSVVLEPSVSNTIDLPAGSCGPGPVQVGWYDIEVVLDADPEVVIRLMQGRVLLDSNVTADA